MFLCCTWHGWCPIFWKTSLPLVFRTLCFNDSPTASPVSHSPVTQLSFLSTLITLGTSMMNPSTPLTVKVFPSSNLVSQYPNKCLSSTFKFNITEAKITVSPSTVAIVPTVVLQLITVIISVVLAENIRAISNFLCTSPSQYPPDNLYPAFSLMFRSLRGCFWPGSYTCQQFLSVCF